MKYYSTGEIAKLCDISIRTVQFYDEKGLLKPSHITEGGRREYNSEDLKKLRLICLYKKFGFSLSTIKDIISKEDNDKTMLLLLEEQEKILENKKEEIDKKCNDLKLIKKSLIESDILVSGLNYDIERIISNKRKLKIVHLFMIFLGIIADILEIGAIVLWIIKGIWWPFIIMLPIVLLLCCYMTFIYIKNTIYICPNCLGKVKPSLKEYLFSKHTAKTRKIYCKKCHESYYAVEIYDEKRV